MNATAWILNNLWGPPRPMAEPPLPGITPSCKEELHRVNSWATFYERDTEYASYQLVVPVRGCYRKSNLTSLGR